MKYKLTMEKITSDAPFFFFLSEKTRDIKKNWRVLLSGILYYKRPF